VPEALRFFSLKGVERGDSKANYTNHNRINPPPPLETYPVQKPGDRKSEKEYEALFLTSPSITLFE
jgi:hypothetical protein